MVREEFENIVAEVIDNLPEQFAKALDNVDIVVEEWPTENDFLNVNAHPGNILFGLYRGIPVPQRPSHYSALPDKIVIFAGPILRFFPELEDAKTQIRNTVLHEIGHHFGMNEMEIRRAERQRKTKNKGL